MTSLSKTLIAVLLAISFTAVVEGINQCITDKCLPGDTTLTMNYCGLQDSDMADIKSCFTALGPSTITSLSFGGNLFTTIPSDLFAGMSSLERIDLWNNDIASLDAATFQPVASTLSVLHLSGNVLTTLPSGLLAGMGTMSIMYFQSNPLTSIPEGIFDDLTSLSYLNMQNAMLSALDVGVFDGLLGIQIVDLRYNALTSLPEGVFENMASGLRFLLLAGNADLQCIPQSPATGNRGYSSYSSTNTYSDAVPNDGLCACTEVATCDDGLACSPGADGYTCAVEVACAWDGDCDTPAGEVCCLTTMLCEVPGTAAACGDPHMTGFRGQKFDFTGEDGGWYAVVSDLPYLHLNMRVTAPVPSLPEITYITGISIVTTDTDGLYNTLVISVRDPHSMASDCPVGMFSCLADGALHVVANGEEIMLTPEEVTLAPGVAIAAVNLPGECRSFGFEKYWEQKKLQLAQPGRRLSGSDVLQDMSDWVLGDPTATNMVECEEYVAAAVDGGSLFEHQSEHASFQIMTPTTTIRLSHGRLHQLPMRDPTDQYDLPDHLAWQMNLAIDHSDLSLDAAGILGETLVPTLDHNGANIMLGMGAIRGVQEDYRVSGPLEVVFSQDQHHE